MVLLIIIPMKNGYFTGKINPTFSDKPTCFFAKHETSTLPSAQKSSLWHIKQRHLVASRVQGLDFLIDGSKAAKKTWTLVPLQNNLPTTIFVAELTMVYGRYIWYNYKFFMGF